MPPEGVEEMTEYCDASLSGLGCVVMQSGQRRCLVVVKDCDYEILHHSGEANVVADALSRKLSSVFLRIALLKMTMTTSFLEMIRQAQEEASRDGNQNKERLLINRDSMEFLVEMRYSFEEVDQSRFSILPGATKMYRDLKTDYWRSRLKRDVALYVESGLTCLKVKVEHQRPYGKMQTLEYRLSSADRWASERKIQTLEDMLRAGVLVFGGSWDTYSPLAEILYRSSIHPSIEMRSYEML
ncbi:hypothetical protein OSB04_002564 [Centaurea solstitialis]|uniref:Uncharacterized protein n=1 Tax=Centaurea solstitialis TaxID=347529 RepID=A0AA38U0Q9_9ASTR|nr:hypothetical protein OSB04_002564 [Centaurea solstitialis]